MFKKLKNLGVKDERKKKKMNKKGFSGLQFIALFVVGLFLLVIVCFITLLMLGAIGDVGLDKILNPTLSFSDIFLIDYGSAEVLQTTPTSIEVTAKNITCLNFSGWGDRINVTTLADKGKNQTAWILNNTKWEFILNPDFIVNTSGRVIIGSGWEGCLDEVRFYTSITDTIVQEINNSGVKANVSLSSTNLLLWFSFNEGTGDTVYDKSGNGYNGTL